MRIAAALIVFLAGCGGHAKPTGILGTLESATAVEAWRISGNPLKSGGDDYFAYPVSSGPLALSASLRGELTQALFDPRIRSGNVHPCTPSPGIKVRYTRPNAEPIWIFFCFECNEIFVYEGSAKREHKGFDDSVAILGSVMKKIFPKDSIIQGLKSD